MCAQFPMLSAPSPPEGASPTPTPPLIPLSTIGSPDAGDLSRTAPSEMHEVRVHYECGYLYTCVYVYIVCTCTCIYSNGKLSLGKVHVRVHVYIHL